MLYGGAWRMYYTGQTWGRSNIGLAESADGIEWRRRSRPVFAAQEAWEEKNVMSPHVIWDGGASLFRMWYSGGPPYEPRTIGHATSSDGVYWARTPQPVFQPAGGLWPLVWDGDRVTACHVEPVDDGYLMFYAGFRDVNHAAIGMAHSSDGVNGSRRLAGNPILRHGHIGRWDSDAVYKPSVVRENDGWRLWYNGRHDSLEQIGLAAHPGRM